MSQSMHFGPEVTEEGVRFSLWAPAAHSVSAVVNNQTVPMKAQKEGWHTVLMEDVKPDSQYHFLINNELAVPDPASRYQPHGIKGDSQIVDAKSFVWTDQQWKGRLWEEAVLYELHIGCFTPEGTYEAIIEKLDYLAQLGITAIELMPIAEFSGTRGWGYDGVLTYAVGSHYGTPDMLKHLVNEAHARGLMMFLDVVYNHFGPEGNFLHQYAPLFFTDQYKTPWGAAINFEHNKNVRRFFIDNALYWLEEFHFDGLRFDAVHAIYDASSQHFLKELAHTIRTTFKNRHIHLVLENDNNESQYLSYDDQTPQFFNAQWNDDIHHIFHVLLTGEQNGYYSDYADAPLERLLRCLNQGFNYQGEMSNHRGGKTRGSPSQHLPPQAFVSFLQNHDQIGNRAFGERITALSSPEKMELCLAVILLAPQIPLLFMGEEWGATTPFLYFCDFHDELARAVREGRRKEFEHFPEFSDPQKRETIPDPNSEDTFIQSKLMWKQSEEPQHAKRRDFVKNLLQLRQRHIVPLLKENLTAISFTQKTPQTCEVIWENRNKRLELRANFSEEKVTFSPCSGECIWGDSSDTLLPLQCQWMVEDIHE